MIRSSLGSRSLWRRKNSRSRRLIRLRRTALPNRFVTTSPSRGLSPGPGAKVMPKCRVLSRRPWDLARRNSLRCKRRSALVKRAVPGELRGSLEAAPRLLSGGWLRRAPRRLHAQALAASGPAAFQYPPPSPGAHAAQKAVGAGPAQIAGLKCTFHAQLSLKPRFFQTFYKTFIPLFVKGKKVPSSQFQVKRKL